jgi:2-desacetyl-2-hydroxyethyl bacteriochlorophyllide A dehydrogenase
MLVYRGQVPPDLGLDLPTLRGSFGYPIKYGYASVGWVQEVGADVESLAAGDLVFVHHPHQSAYVVPASLPIRLPPATPPEAAVFLANLETAVNVMLDAAPRFGERIVIFGQGVIGLLLTQLARRAGSGLVMAVDPISRRRDLAAQLGAQRVLPPGPDVPEQVRELTGGIGADLALEASGSGSALDAAVDCVAPGGAVVVCSWYGTKSVTLHLGGTFHRGRKRLVSSQVGSVDPALSPRWDARRRMAVAVGLLAELELQSLITHRVPFRDAARAYALVDAHPEETVQVVLTYGESDV